MRVCFVALNWGRSSWKTVTFLFLIVGGGFNCFRTTVSVAGHPHVVLRTADVLGGTNVSADTIKMLLRRGQSANLEQATILIWEQATERSSIPARGTGFSAILYLALTIAQWLEPSGAQGAWMHAGLRRTWLISAYRRSRVCQTWTVCCPSAGPWSGPCSPRLECVAYHQHGICQ